MLKHRVHSAYYVFAPPKKTSVKEDVKIFRITISSKKINNENCQFLQLEDLKFLQQLGKEGKGQCKMHSKVTVGLCQDLKRSMRSVINYSEMSKKKLNFVVRKYLRNFDVQNREMLTALQDEWMRLWQFSLVI